MDSLLFFSVFHDEPDKIIKVFSTLVGEKGPRIPGVKDSRAYFLKILSAPLAFHSTP